MVLGCVKLSHLDCLAEGTGMVWGASCFPGMNACEQSGSRRRIRLQGETGATMTSLVKSTGAIAPIGMSCLGLKWPSMFRHGMQGASGEV
jgi:hypothetical protein